MCGPSFVYFLFGAIYGRVKRLTKRMTSRRGGRVSASRRPRVSPLGETLAALRHAEWVTVASARADEADQSARGTYWNGSWAPDDDLRGSALARGNEHHPPFRLIRLRANRLVRITNHRKTDVFTSRLISRRSAAPSVITDFVSILRDLSQKIKI